MPVAVAYVVAAAAAIGCGFAVGADDPLVTALYADVVATLVVFGFSVAYGNSSFYDPYWSVAPIGLVAYWIAVAPAGVDTGRSAVIAVLVTAWGVRLTWNWLRGWGGLDHEDWRYVDIRAKTGALYWPASLAGIHMFPTAQVFLGCLPVYTALTAGTRGLGWLDAIAALVTAAAILIESIADDQLRAFAKDKQPGEIMARGLWKYSRHPNYFGEALFWWGLYLFAVAAGVAPWWTVLGAASITVMFVFVSIPMMERRSLARRPAFAAHQKAVSMFIPLPRRSPG